MKIYSLSKCYTRIIGTFFLLVSISLIIDLISYSFRPETMHKIFHVLLGIIVIYYGWNSRQFQKYFPIINGLFFTYITLFGFLFHDFADLDAFNSLDNFLHLIVGVSGIAIAIIDKNHKSKLKL